MRTRHVTTAPTVVGYSNKDLRGGFKMVGANFNDIDKNGAENAGIDLTAIKVTNYNLDDYDGMILGNFNAQIMNSTGDGGVIYSWNDWPGIYEAGWYAEGSEVPVEPGEVTIPVCTGLWVYGEDGVKFGDSGAVDQNDRTIPLRGGFLGVANPFAIQIDLSTVTITGYNLEDYDGMILGNFNAQKMNSTGDGGEIWAWNDWPGIYEAGWYAEGSETPIAEDEAFLTPGEGLWVYGEEGTFINFPAPTIAQ